MTEKNIVPGMRFESNTLYHYTGTQLDITMADTADGPAYYGIGKKVAFCLKGLENVTLDFGGAVLMLHGKIQPFYAEDCRNLTIRHVKVKYDRSSVTEGLILERTENSLRVRLHPEHTCRVENRDLIVTAPTWENHNLNSYLMFMTATDGETHQGCGGVLGLVGREPKLDTRLPYAKGATLWTAEADGDDVVFHGQVPGMFVPGRILTLSHEPRTVSSLAAVNCIGLTAEDFRIVNGIGMGIMPIHCRDVFLLGLTLFYDELSSGVTTNGADGVHAFACSGTFLMKDCVLEGMVDDALNIHSNFYQLERACGRTLRAKALSPDGTSIPIFFAGDRVRVLRGSTLEVKGEAVLQEIRTIDDRTVEMELDTEIPDPEAGDTLENLSGRCDLTVTHCRMGKSPMSHARFQNGGKTRVEDCESEFQFLLTGDMSYWYESDPVEDMTVRNVRFSRHSPQIHITPEFFPSAGEPFYHKHLTVEDCTFDTEVPVKAFALASIDFKGNRQINGKPMSVILTNCGDACTEGCSLVREQKEKNNLGFN